jgi:hypothetical protein
MEKPKAVLIVYDVAAPEDPETSAFILFWRDFSLKFNSLDTASTRKITLDSIWLWGVHVSSAEFMKRYYNGYSNSDLPKMILDVKNTSYGSVGYLPDPPVGGAIVKGKDGNFFSCKEATIRDTIGAEVTTLEFTFLQTTRGYKLFGISFYTYNWSLGFPFDSMVDTTAMTSDH